MWISQAWNISVSKHNLLNKTYYTDIGQKRKETHILGGEISCYIVLSEVLSTHIYEHTKIFLNNSNILINYISSESTS